MKSLKKRFNADFLLLFLMSVVNLLFLHHYFLQTIGLEVGCFKSSLVDNLLACLLDVTFVLLVSWIVTLRRVRASLMITFAITLIWSFCNVFYARFFHQYLSWSSIGLAGNLADPIVLDSMSAGFRLIDLFYPLMIILFCWLCYRSRRHDVKSESLRTLLYTWLSCLLIGLAVHSLYFFHSHIGFVYELEKTVFTPEKMDSMWPNWTFFHKGFFRKLILDQLKRNSKLELTKEQEAAIEKEYSDHSQRVTGRTAPDHVKNVIFILVESYLSVTSDLFVDGQEITPNLNKLRRDSNVYFNSHMIPNVSIGESSDGQLIYMAGLMPLHSEITVSKAKKNSIIGLPEQIKKAYPDLHSLTIIPTTPSLWDQQAMSDSYGFDKLYSMLDYQAEMKDNESILTHEKVLYLTRRFLGKFVAVIENTWQKYVAILKSYKASENDLLGKLQRISNGSDTRRDNDTPQDGGDFDDDPHTSFISNGTTDVTESYDDTSLIERLDKIQRLYQKTLLSWLNEFRGLFVEGGNIHEIQRWY